MRRKLGVLALVCAAAGCAAPENDGSQQIESVSEELSIGQNQGGFLTLQGGSLPSTESARQADTCGTGSPAPCGGPGLSYYTKVGISPDGSTAAGTIASNLATLSAFKSFYGFPTGEVRTLYYNRGDLGIGRDMHCIDKLNVTGNKQIACFVTNFAAGSDGSEFTFGLSTNIAFANMTANNSFATVAMVYRDLMPADAQNRVFFVVYDKNGNLSKFAALDRHGITFANEFAKTTPNNPDTTFGTPGVTFNNHIPSNCVSCHGGQQYAPSTHTQVGSLFLPFDLDQFSYDTIAGRTRSDQLVAFKHQNEMVRKVAALSATTSNAAGTSIKNQLDTWYHNTNHTGQTDRTEIFESDFDSSAVISGWSSGGAGAIAVYQAVVRKDCRNCHMSNQLGITFDTESQFKLKAAASAAFLCSKTTTMPHSLQSLREFWTSNAPSALVSYFNSVGLGTAATTIAGCAPGISGGMGSLVTLDPPQAMAGLNFAIQ